MKSHPIAGTGLKLSRVFTVFWGSIYALTYVLTYMDMSESQCNLYGRLNEYSFFVVKVSACAYFLCRVLILRNPMLKTKGQDEMIVSLMIMAILAFLFGLISVSRYSFFITQDGCEVTAEGAALLFSTLSSVFETIVNIGFMVIFLRPIAHSKSHSVLFTRTKISGLALAGVSLLLELTSQLVYSIFEAEDNEYAVSVFGYVALMWLMTICYSPFYSSLNWIHVLFEFGKKKKKKKKKTGAVDDEVVVDGTIQRTETFHEAHDSDGDELEPDHKTAV